MKSESLPVVCDLSRRPGYGDCWNRIGVRGDRTCPELAEHIHCQNCPVFASAGRRFLDAPAPAGYREEWTKRLAPPADQALGDTESVLTFRIGGEWLALGVAALVEVAPPKPIRRVPHRAGVLAGIVNIRGELTLCVHLGRVLGIDKPGESAEKPASARMIVARRDAERWAFPVDEVDQVHRVPRAEVRRPPATVSRAAHHLSRGVFPLKERSVGLLDDARLFEALRAKLR